MSKRRPVHPRTVLQWLLVIAMTAGMVLAVRGVRLNAPSSDQDFAIPEAADIAELETTVERCERTLPNEPVLPDTNGVRNFGRVSSTAVVECPDIFDGQDVVYVGEVVGDILRRDGGTWVLVNDDDYALSVGPAGASGELRGQNSGLSVWLPDPMADELTRAGGPGWRGDVIQVAGTIRRVDPDDGGGLTLRARGMTIVTPATAVERPLNLAQLVLAIGLTLIAGALFAIERRMADRR